MQPLFVQTLTFDDSRLTNVIFSSAAVVAAAAVVFFAADFFVVGFGFPCLAVDLAVCSAIAVAAVVGFAAFFFYPFFQDSANLYVPPHPQIQVQLPAVLMK